MGFTHPRTSVHDSQPQEHLEKEDFGQDWRSKAFEGLGTGFAVVRLKGALHAY